MGKVTITQQLAGARIAIENAMGHTRIQQLLNKVGYTQQVLLQGKGLYEVCMDQQQQLKGWQGKQQGATNTFNQDLKAAKTLYSRHRKLAKVAYEGNVEKFIVLQLNTNPARMEDWLQHAGTFYSTLNTDSKTIQKFGVTKEELAQAQAMIDSLLSARHRQISCKGEAQHAIQQRNQALDKLKNWMDDFKLATRFALRNNDQYLEVLGIQVRSPSRA